MPDQVWRVTLQSGASMYFWNQTKAIRYASDHSIFTAPVLVDRPDGQPIN